jgi:PAS domain-containing protein
MIRNRSLKLIFAISLITAVVFPIVSITVIYPSFTRMLVENTEEEASRTGQHLSEMLLSDSAPLNRQSINTVFSREVESLLRNFKLLKIKVFTSSGEIIYSTDEEEIGNVNDNVYFHEIVAQGRPYSMGVKKDTQSLEGQVLSADVIETYVPIMLDSLFVGAFELYYDVTSRNIELNRNIFLSSIIPMVLMLIFLVSIVAVLVRAEDNGLSPTISEQSLRYRSPFFSMAMIALSLFIAQLIVFTFIRFIPDGGSWLMQSTLASTVLVMLISPTMYFFFVQPLMQYIGERSRVERELTESRASLAREHESLQGMFRQVEVAKIEWERTMDCVSDVILLTDRDGNLQRYNRSLDRLMGRSCREYIGKEWKALLRDLCLEPDPTASDETELIQAETGKRFSMNASAFYHSDLNLCGTVITLHERVHKEVPLPGTED